MAQTSSYARARREGIPGRTLGHEDEQLPVEITLKDITTVRNEPQRLWHWAEIATRFTRGQAH